MPSISDSAWEQSAAVLSVRATLTGIAWESFSILDRERPQE